MTSARGTFTARAVIEPLRPSPIRTLSPTPPEGIDLAVAAAKLADEKHAEDIVILDLRGLSNIADFFVVCSANSPPHLNAVRKEVADRLKTESGVATYGLDGPTDSLWTVLDFVDVVVHILHAEKRAFYGLETLWSDAPRVAWQSANAAGA